jgi:hypothetical protein
MAKNLAKFLAPATKREKDTRAKLAHAAAPPASHVFGYARVSTAEQVENGQSLDVQQRVISGYAMQHGLTVEKVFVERGVTGSKPLRADVRQDRLCSRPSSRAISSSRRSSTACSAAPSMRSTCWAR